MVVLFMTEIQTDTDQKYSQREIQEVYGAGCIGQRVLKILYYQDQQNQF